MISSLSSGGGSAYHGATSATRKDVTQQTNDDNENNDDEQYDDVEILETSQEDDADDPTRSTRDGIMKDSTLSSSGRGRGATSARSSHFCRILELLGFLVISTIVVTVFFVSVKKNDDDNDNGKLINNDKQNIDDTYQYDTSTPPPTSFVPLTNDDGAEDSAYLPPDREGRDKIKNELKQTLLAALKQKLQPEKDDDYNLLDDYILNWSTTDDGNDGNGTTIDNDTTTNNPSSSYRRALQWIVYEDPRALQPDDPSLLQRYVLALLYFVTTQNGQEPWDSCNPPFTTLDEADGDVTDFCMRQNAFSSLPTHAWLSGHSECRWTGVGCTNEGRPNTVAPVEVQHISGLDLSYQNIASTVPVEVKYLSDTLSGLDFSFNSMRNPFPESYPIYLGPNLEYLNLRNHTDLSGSIPSTWWKGFPNIVRLYLSNNGLTGTVPFDVISSTMKSLSALSLNDNGFAGIINTQLGLLTNLYSLSLNNNQFVGQFPSEIGNLVNCGSLKLHDLPNIQGQIPTEIGQLAPKLRNLKFSGSVISGSLPTEIFSLTKLQSLEVSDMPLAASESSSVKRFVGGTIPTTIGQLTNLYDLRLHKAGMSGSIPSELGLLSKLTTLWLQGNDLKGSVPDEVCKIHGVGGMTEFIADCAVSSANPDAAILTCPDQCCTSCCVAGEFETCNYDYED